MGPASIREPPASTHDQLKEGELSHSETDGPSLGPPADGPAACPLPGASSSTREKVGKGAQSRENPRRGQAQVPRLPGVGLVTSRQGQEGSTETRPHLQFTKYSHPRTR